MTKKLLSILLTIVMVLSIAPVAVFAENDILDYLEYEIIDGEVTITGCDKSISGDVVIPDTIEGYPVTAISQEAFSYCRLIKEITIPASVNEIDFWAFEDIFLLTRFNVSEENQYYSNDEHGVLFNKDKTALIQYPIGNKAISYDIPVGVVVIYGLSFASANYLENIKIPDTVTTIGGEAFFTCINLKSIVVPSSVTEMYYSTFQNCYSLEKAEIYSSVICDSMFLCCLSLKDVYISENVKSIDRYAFYKCFSLEEIKIPKSVEFIDRQVFYDCKSLKDIYIKNPNAEIYELSVEDLDYDETTMIGFTDIKLLSDKQEFMKNIQAFCDIYDEYWTMFDKYKDSPELMEQFEKESTEKMISAESELNKCFEYLDEPVRIDDLTIHGYEDSTTETYANKYELKFVPICDHINTETINISKADCENDGYTGDIYCNDCKEIIEYGETVPSAGHNYIENIIKEPTYSQDGLKNTVCDKCGDTTAEEVIPQLTIEDSESAENTDSDISIIYPEGTFDGEIKVEVTPVADDDAFKLISHKQGNYKVTMFDINITVDGQKVQPNGTVLVKIPLPKGYNQNKCVVYYVADDGTMEELTTYHFKDGYVYFETDHFSYYAVIEDVEETENAPDEELSFVEKLIAFFKMIIDFFKQIFGMV